MTIQEQIAVMQAFADGKEIEYRSDGNWAKVNYPSWNWAKYIYRVKPEPKLRPYKNAEEFFEAQQRHGLYFQEKGVTVGYFPFRVSDNWVTWDTAAGTKTVDYERLLREYHWQDGSPCGVWEGDEK